METVFKDKFAHGNSYCVTYANGEGPRMPRFSASVHDVLADGIRKLSKVSNNCRRLKYTAA